MRNKKVSIQEKQDKIFRNMSADKKLELFSHVWKRTTELVQKKRLNESRRLHIFQKLLIEPIFIESIFI